MNKLMNCGSQSVQVSVFANDPARRNRAVDTRQILTITVINWRSTNEGKKGSPYSITERRVPELIPVLCSQPAGDVNHKPDGRLLLGAYFPPGLQLPPQPLRGLLPVLLLGEQRHDGCEQFA